MSDEFVKMVKLGEEPIEVHPSVVEDHKRLGWKVFEETPAADAPVEESESGEDKSKSRIRRRIGTKDGE